MTNLQAIERENLRRDLPPFRTGDTVRVHVKVREGEKERIQVFEGVVLRRRKGGASASFTVRKISYGVGVERVFPIESPSVSKVEIKSRGHVRRSRIYYLRELRGKKARLRSKVRDLSGLISDEERDLREHGTADAAAAAAEQARVEAAAEQEAAAPEETGQAEEAPEAAPEAPADGKPAADETPAEGGAEDGDEARS